MKIVNMLKPNRYLTVNDLELGDTFVFQDNDDNSPPPYLFMMCGDGNYFVNLDDGELIEISDENQDIPIQKVHCFITVKS